MSVLRTPDPCPPAVTLGIQTGLRNGELRFLRWRQVDLLTRAIKVGKSKTPSGEDRIVPLNKTAAKVLTTWAQQFPGRTPEHYVFPSERVPLPRTTRKLTAPRKPRFTAA